MSGDINQTSNFKSAKIWIKFLFYVLSFFKKGDTIQGGTLFKEIRYLFSLHDSIVEWWTKAQISSHKFWLKQCFSCWSKLSNIFLELDHNWLYITLHLLQIKFKLTGWHEYPIKSVVLTFPIDEIFFPTVTLCPRDSRPDRWGSVIKIFDQLNTNCESNR